MNATSLPQRQRRVRKLKNELAQAQTALTAAVKKVEPQKGPPQATPLGGGRRRRRRTRNRGFRNRNSYLDALLYPESCKGCKVPDVSSYSSMGFQCTFDNTFTLNASGEAAHAYSVLGENGTMSSTVAASVITWTALTDYPFKAGMSSVFSFYRPVSAVMWGEFIGATNTDQGQIAVALLARDEAVPTTFGTIISHANSFIFPLRNGFRILWKPEDNKDMEYEDTDTSGWSGIGGFSPHPAWVVMVTGGQASSTCLRFRIVINYEGIPGEDTNNFIGAEPSPIDLGSFQSALSTLSQTIGATTWTSYAGGLGAIIGQQLVARYAGSTGPAARRNGFVADMV